jgi:lysophospholipase L1-like esterase
MRQPWFFRLRQRVSWRLARADGRVHGNGPLLVAIGDSLTDPASGSTLPWQVWPRRVTREGYRTVNLGVSGETTADMRRRIEQTLREGKPDIVVLFGGANDALHHIDPAETERNVTQMVDWLQNHGVTHIALIGPMLANLASVPEWSPALEDVRSVIKGVATRRGARFVDLAGFLRDRIDRGQDPDFARVPYRQSRSWHVRADDPHFNAYGQRLVAEAFLAATADWRRAR